MDNRQLTREGNEIFPTSCTARSAMRKAGALCAECVHAADLCTNIEKSKSAVKGFSVITRCTGFEEIGKRVEG